MTSQRVLLTGETGFLGKRVHALLCADTQLSVVPLSARLPRLVGATRLEADVVVHLAAWTTKRAGDSNLPEIVDANVAGLLALLEALDPPPRRFLFASTADVYGAGNAGRLREDSPLHPIDAYAASKLLGEHIVKQDARDRGYQACAMRIGHLYGPGEQAYEKFVPAAITALMKGRPPTVVGDGTTRRDLLYVDDAAEAIRRLVLSGDALPEILNLASPDTYTLNEIAQTLIEIVGFLGRIRYLSDHATPPSIGFDTKLLEKVLGPWQRLALTEGLRREIDSVVAAERLVATSSSPV
ncbi:MAG TPA: NAD-dependent epimerase/dehydratase family protein [Solirubrobacteraceae bacterium]|nr:NAD-dependent epimerase/dehydratase family protein [Solirubrobacteraceae bacterium]